MVLYILTFTDPSLTFWRLKTIQKQKLLYETPLKILKNTSETGKSSLWSTVLLVLLLLLFGSLFYNDFSVTRLYSVDDGVTSEWWWRRIDDDKHSCLKQDSKPWSQHPSDQGLWLRPHSHWDRKEASWEANICLLVKIRTTFYKTIKEWPLCSQQPANSPCLVTDKSKLSTLTLPFHLYLGLPSYLFSINTTKEPESRTVFSASWRSTQNVLLCILTICVSHFLFTESMYLFKHQAR
jgi:hypothetical protein